MKIVARVKSNGLRQSALAKKQKNITIFVYRIVDVSIEMKDFLDYFITNLYNFGSY